MCERAPDLKGQREGRPRGGIVFGSQRRTAPRQGVLPMGSHWCLRWERGRDPEDAFWRAIDRAEKEAGVEAMDGPYFGDIRAKRSFVFFRTPPEVSPEEYEESLDWHHPWREKWGGVAGCRIVEEIPGGESLYQFFGWAPC